MLPAPTAPSEGSAGVRNLVCFCPKAWLTRSRSWLTSSGVAFHPTAPSRGGARPIYSTARPEGSLVFRPVQPVLWNPNSRTEVLELKAPGQSRPMFCGPSWDNLYRVPLCSPSSFSPKRLEVRSRVARQEDYLFRRLFPAGPEKNRNSSHCLPAEIGPLVTCRTLLPLPALGEAGTAVPITQ